MRAYIAPYTLTCGSCGNVLHMNRWMEKHGAMKVQCFSAQCPDKGKTFIYDLPAVEMHEAPKEAVPA